MTVALSVVGRRRRAGGGLRLHRQHLGLGGGVRGQGGSAARSCCCRPGRIADGQAGPGDRARRARWSRSRATSTTACELARKLADDYPVTLVNSVNPVRIEGQKTAAFEIVDDLGDAPDLHVLPVGNAGNISAYWRGYTQYAQAGTGHADAADVGLPGRRRRTAGARSPGARTRRPWPPRSGSATRPRPTLAVAARDESGGLIEAVTDDEILAAQAFLAAREGIFVEPASAAGVAGLLAQADARASSTSGQQIVVTVTGHGLKDIDTALSGRGPVQAEVVPADLLAIASVCGLSTEPASMQAAPGRSAVTVEVPATSANLGPGFDCFGLALDWREQVELTVLESGFAIEVSGEGADADPAGRDPPDHPLGAGRAGRSRACACPGCGSRCHNTIPHGRGLGSSSAAIVAGLLGGGGTGRVEPRTRAWLLRHATAIEGHPDNVAAAIYGGFVLAYEGRRRGRRGPRPGRIRRSARPCSSPSTSVDDQRRRAGCCPSRCRTSTPPRTPAGPRCWCTRWPASPTGCYDATRDWLHQDYREPAMPRSYELVTALRGQGFAAVISGAGPSGAGARSARPSCADAGRRSPAAGFAAAAECGIGQRGRDWSTG